jgi:hypothetical protein
MTYEGRPAGGDCVGDGDAVTVGVGSGVIEADGGADSVETGDNVAVGATTTADGAGLGTVALHATTRAPAIAVRAKPVRTTRPSAP